MAELLNDESFVTSPNNGMDYGKALTWYFSDPLFWSNTLKFSLLTLSIVFILPIFYVVPLFMGYMIELSGNIQNGEYKLPELGSEGQWQSGLFIWLISFAVSLVSMFVYSLITLPFSLLTSFGDSEAAGGFAILYILISFVLQIGYYVFLMYSSFAMQAIYAKTKNLNSVFNIDNIKYVISKNKVSIIVAVLVMYAASLAFGFVGLLLLCIGLIPAMFLTYNVMATLIGQLDVAEVL